MPTKQSLTIEHQCNRKVGNNLSTESNTHVQIHHLASSDGPWWPLSKVPFWNRTIYFPSGVSKFQNTNSRRNTWGQLHQLWIFWIRHHRGPLQCLMVTVDQTSHDKPLDRRANWIPEHGIQDSFVCNFARKPFKNMASHVYWLVGIYK